MNLLQVLITLFTTGGLTGLAGGVMGLILGLVFSPNYALELASFGCIVGFAWPFIKDTFTKQP